MGGTSRIDPLITIDLMIADNVPDAIVKDLGAAAGKRINSCFFQFLQGLANRQLGALGEERHLNHRECFKMNLRKALFQAGNQIQKILKRQVRMKTADDVKLCDSFRISRSCRLPRLFESHRVGSRRVLFSAKCTETTRSDTYVSGIDMAVDIEKRRISPQFFAYVIGEPADGKNIARPIQSNAICKAKPF